MTAAGTAGKIQDEMPSYADTLPPSSARLRFLAQRIHRLGSRPLYELLRELVDGADPLPRPEAYAALAPLAVIADLDGDQLQPAVRLVRRAS